VGHDRGVVADVVEPEALAHVTVYSKQIRHGISP
jgi:hypothetical protein